MSKLKFKLEPNRIFVQNGDRSGCENKQNDKLFIVLWETLNTGIGDMLDLSLVLLRQKWFKR